MHNKHNGPVFKKPEQSSDSEMDDVVQAELDGIEWSDSDADSDDNLDNISNHLSEDNSETEQNQTDSDVSMTDDDDDDDEDDDEDHDDDDSTGDATTKTAKSEKTKAAAAAASSEDGPGTSSSAAAANLNESDEEDETVRAIIAAIKKPRSTPPEIITDDFITDICFHPQHNIIALATITGDVSLYQYKNKGNTLLRTIEIHAKACRDVEFTDDGLNLLTCSKDKSIMVTDMTTEKLKKFYESAHDEPINKIHVVNENLFATGDDSGMVKLWDLRTKHDVFALKEVEDYITQMLTNDDKNLLLCTSGDGYLTTINLRAKKLYVQSEPYDQELTCMGTYRGDSKLVVGTTKGRLYTFNWGQFGYHCDMFPGVGSSMSVMVPITNRIGCVAGEDGVIRATHIAPFRNLGIVGQHTMPIESMDVNNDGSLIATSSHNNDVRFWNVKYFEDFGDIKYNEKHNAHKEKSHNLPSSKFSNAGDFFSDLAKPPSDDDADDA